MIDSKKFTRFVNIIILIFAIPIFCFLFLQRLFSTSFVGYFLDENNAKVNTIQYIRNNPIYMVMFLVIFIALLVVVKIRFGKRIEQFIVCNHKKIMKVLCVVDLLMCVFWVVSAQVPPDSDPAKVFLDVQKWRGGDFSTYLKHGYVYRYPFQIGMTTYFYLLSFVFGTDNYLGMQLVNGLLIPFILLATVKSLCKTHKNREIMEVFSYGSSVFWLPLTIYSTYIYGLIPAMIFCWLGAYVIQNFYDNPKIRGIICAGILLGLGVFLKGNNKIWVAVFLCIFAYDIIRNLLGEKNIKTIILELVLIVVLTACAQVGDMAQMPIAEKISGYEAPPEMPILPWVNMGLSDNSDFAPGYYDGYQVNVRIDNDYDYDRIMSQSVSDLQKRLEEFANSPKKGINFFARKIGSQWNEPTYLSIYKIRNLLFEKIDKPWLESLLVGNLFKLYREYCNIYQLLLWFGCLLYLFFKYIDGDKADRMTIVSYMGIVLFMGGFILHLFWEAMGPYAVPYIVAVIPYAVMGYAAITTRIANYIVADNHRLERESLKKYTVLAVIIVFVLAGLGISGLWSQTISLDSGEDAHTQYAQVGETYEVYSPGETMLLKQSRYGRDYEKSEPYEYTVLKNQKAVVEFITNESSRDGIFTDKAGFRIVNENANYSGISADKVYGNGLESGDDRIILEPINTGRPGKNRDVEVIIRSRNTGHVLANQNGQLISYMDNEINRMYEENVDAEYVWNVIWHDDGSVSFIQDSMALTVGDNQEIVLKGYDESIEGQRFSFLSVE